MDLIPYELFATKDTVVELNENIEQYYSQIDNILPSGCGQDDQTCCIEKTENDQSFLKEIYKK